MQPSQPMHLPGVPPIRVARYGSGRRAVLYLPTSGGDVTEFARYGLPEVLAPWADRYCIYAIDAHGPTTLFDDGLTPPERIARYAEAERAIVDRVLPRIREESGAARIDLWGASYGAFVAANLMLKVPKAIGNVLLLGGVFQMWHRLADFRDETGYFHMPLSYLPGLDDAEQLAAIRDRSIELFAARDDSWLDESFALREILDAKAIPHRFDLWESPHGHHESTWRLQLAKSLALRHQ